MRALAALVGLAACGGLALAPRGPLDRLDLLYTSVAWDHYDDGTGNDELRLRHPDARTSVVVHARSDGRIQHAVWSPDGRRIAFTRGVIEGVEEGLRERIEVVTPGSSPEVVAELDQGVVWGPQWSPDGSRLLASLRAAGSLTSRAVVVDVPGPGARFLSPAAVDAREPRWSRDGTEVLFVDATAGRLWRVNVATGEGGPVTLELDRQPAVRGVEVARHADLLVIVASDAVYTMPPAGGPLTEIPVPPGAEHIAHSRDGSLLAYVHSDRGQRRLYVLPLPAGPARLAYDGQVHGRYSWGPGDWLAFGADGRVLLVRVNGGDVIEATDSSRYDANPVFRP